jgi:hypothetical protein
VLHWRRARVPRPPFRFRPRGLHIQSPGERKVAQLQGISHLSLKRPALECVPNYLCSTHEAAVTAPSFERLTSTAQPPMGILTSIIPGDVWCAEGCQG